MARVCVLAACVRACVSAISHATPNESVYFSHYEGRFASSLRFHDFPKGCYFINEFLVFARVLEDRSIPHAARDFFVLDLREDAGSVVILAQLPSLVSSRARDHFSAIFFSANRDGASKSDQQRRRVIEFGKFFVIEREKARERATFRRREPVYEFCTTNTYYSLQPETGFFDTVTPGYCILACKIHGMPAEYR